MGIDNECMQYGETDKSDKVTIWQSNNLTKSDKIEAMVNKTGTWRNTKKNRRWTTWSCTKW